MITYIQNLTQWLKKPSLSRDYFYFFLATIITVLVISCYVTWHMYQSYLDKIQCQLELEAKRIESKIDGVFNDAAQILILVGKEIVKHNDPNDLEYISSLLIEKSNLKIKANDFLTVDSFIWINAKNYQTINRKEGVVKHPYNMSHRDHLDKCKQHPWTLQLSHPGKGIPNGLWVIPVGVGVFDNKGKYFGNIALGFRIAELTQTIKQQLDSSLTNFIVLNNTDKLIMNSSIHSSRSIEKFFLDHTVNLKDKTQEFSVPLEINNIIYLYTYKIPKYDYTILVGLDKRIINNEFYSIVFPRVLECLGLGLFCLLLLCFFRKKIINPITRLSQIAVFLSAGNTETKIPRQSSVEMYNLARALLQVIRYIKRNEKIHSQLKQTYDRAKASDEAKEEFLRRINHELKRPLYSIIWHSDILIKHFQNAIQVNIPSKKQVEMLVKIQESANNLHDLTTNVLNLSDVDVGSVIEYCLRVEAKAAILKNITLESFLQPNLPSLYADELRFKQIIVGLISLCIDYTYDGGTINVFSSLENTPQTTSLKIVLEDDGFAFDKEDIKRLSTCINKKSAGHVFDSSDLDLDLVEKLVKMHEGEIEIVRLGQKGKRITLTLPYRNKATINIFSGPDLSGEVQDNHNVYKIY